jgi:hypothetical protein
MKIIQPPYWLNHCDVRDWRFEESDEMSAASEEFFRIMDRYQGRAYVSAVARFLGRHPNHIDALHHYALCKLDQGKCLEALAFSHAAVATGMRIFPKEFAIGRDRLDTGYIKNRPFLRAVHGLMSAQRAVGLTEDAVGTAQMALGFDPGDRNGVRLELPVYLLELNRDAQALKLFEDPAYDETFHGVEYLHALTLIRMNRQEGLKKIWSFCLGYYPLVAKYLLDPTLPIPPNEDAHFGGVVMFSEFEGWMHANQFRHLWRTNRAAMDLLRKEAEPYAQRNWERPKSTLGLPIPLDAAENRGPGPQ